MVNKETQSKKLKRKAKVNEKKKDNLFELKITHVLPKYEKTKNVEIHDSSILTVWQDSNSINVWIGDTIIVMNVEDWADLKKELRLMLLKDIKIKEDFEDED